MSTNTGTVFSPPAAHDTFRPLLLDPRVDVVVAYGFALLAGAMIGLLLPHGPATPFQTAMVLLICLTIGGFAGWATQSRWAVLLTPLAHVVALEAMRLGLHEPSVASPRLDSLYGVLALLLGRGFYAIVALMPMMLGAVLGVMASRPVMRPVTALGWMPAGIASLGVLLLLAAIVSPATTPAIRGADGRVLHGSIATLEKVRLGGADQWIMIRAHSANKPVLLYLSGGPGQSDLAFSRVMFDAISQDFVVVSWDQRGTGKSNHALDPVAQLTLEQAILDTIELSELLRTRFGESKIYLLGESWGSTLGVLAVQRRPDLYFAWIGSGQMVSQSETDKRLYHDVIAQAEKAGDTNTISQMRAYGEPPYADIPYANAFVMGKYEGLYKPYTPPQAYMDRGNASAVGPYGVLASEYNFVEKVNVLRGLIDMFTVMYPQLQEIDFRRDVPRLEVPVYMLDGQAELTGRRDLALEWFETLRAPRKQLVSFENAAHSVVFEQFEAVHTLLVQRVVPETYAH